MKNPRLAYRYAKSILGLAVERNELEAVKDDMQLLAKICKENPEFTMVLDSPVIPASKKKSIIEAVLDGKVNEMTTLFIRLLLQKHRELNLPQIAQSFQEQYNVMHNIHKVIFTSAAPVSEELQQEIAKKIKADKQLENIEWEAHVDESLIGGFKLQLADLLIDASISNDLKDIKRQFMNNDYMHKLR